MATAKPDLTTPVDFTIIHQNSMNNSKQSQSYQFVSEHFSQTAPVVDSELQQLAKPRNYQVWLGLPPSSCNDRKNIDSSRPIIYILDGNAAIDLLTPDVLNQLANADNPPILVYIGYQTPYKFDVQSRAYDYTPAVVIDEFTRTAVQDALNNQLINGGAEHFSNVIQTQIKPWVTQQVNQQGLSINSEQQTLWGHSYGGLFVLYTLLYHPNYFSHYHSADPSLWWHDGEVIKQYKNLNGSTNINGNENIEVSTKDITILFSGQINERKTNALNQLAKSDTSLLSANTKIEFAEFLCDESFNIRQEDTSPAHTIALNCQYSILDDKTHGEIFSIGLQELYQHYF